MTAEPAVPPPDDKDWTWVLGRPCPECGFEADSITREDIPRLVREAVTAFRTALGRPDAATRPSPDVWSPLEYGCHVRDVCARFDERVRLMLDTDDPLFANWDQNATAVEDRYWTQQPAAVAAQLAEAGEDAAGAFEGVAGDDWSRAGRRSNGSAFTVESLGRYFVHDLVHHAHDVRSET